ncbi:MAG: amidohydrolase family protein [Dehalococcoidia bacterium]
MPTPSPPEEANVTYPATSPATVLFRNVRIFNGTGETLSARSHVLVRGATIELISATPLSIEDQHATIVIEGGDRVLMPGLIDAHAHTMFMSLPVAIALTADTGYVYLVAGVNAERTLLRGFTSVRDVGGPAFALKRAIDEGVVTGPRIYPSGAMISQTSGHGDFRMRHELPRGVAGSLSQMERNGSTAIADGVDEVLRATREQLLMGASQIKLMAGGGVSSPHDPIDATQYTEAELHAAVEAAENWGTYVMVHAYTPNAIQRSIVAGVKCIEHGQLADEPTIALMAEKGIWWSLQPFLDDEDAIPLSTPDQRANQLLVTNGTVRAYELAKKHGVKLAWGSDTLFDAKLAERQGAQLAKLNRWISPAQVLRMATADNAELLALSGPRNPYPGKLGVIEEGALADLLLVDGNPLEDITLVADPAKAFVVIMKDGTIYKNTLK